MSHANQIESYEMLSGSGASLSPSTDNSDDNSVSEGEQTVAITIACVFVVLLVAKLAHSMYLMRKRRLLEVGNAVVEQTEAVVDMTKVTTCEVGCQTDPVDGENTCEVGCQTDPVDDKVTTCEVGCQTDPVDDKVTTCEVGCQTDPVDGENTTTTHRTTNV